MAALGGVLITLSLLGLLAIGECLPHDHSTAMRACERAKSIQLWVLLIPSIAIVLAGCWKVIRGDWAGARWIVLNWLPGLVAAFVAGMLMNELGV